MKTPWEATEGVAEGDSQGGAAVRWPPTAFAFGSAKANQALSLGYDWLVEGIVSFEGASRHKSRISNSCRSVPGRFCGFVPPFRYAMECAV